MLAPDPLIINIVVVAMQLTRRLVVDIKGVISREQKCRLILLNLF